MTTLFDMSLLLAKKITAVRSGGLATAGDTLSLADTSLESMGTWADGTVWILSGTYAGNSRKVFQNPNDKLTWLLVLGGAIAVGVRYALADKKYPRDILMGAIDSAMQFFPGPETENIALVVDPDVDTYTLPAGVSRLIKVEVARSSSAPYRYDENRYWGEVDGELRFRSKYRPLVTGRIIRVTYEGSNSELYQDADVIPAHIDMDALFWRSIIELYGSAKNLRPKDKSLDAIFSEAQTEWQRRVPRKPRRNDPLAG